jgi:hypothetical protein
MAVTCLLAIIIFLLMSRLILLKATLIFFLENILDTLNNRVFFWVILRFLILIGIIIYLPLTVTFGTKLKGDEIHSAIYFLGLNQRNYPDDGSNLLDFVFSSNFADLSVDHAEYGLNLIISVLFLSLIVQYQLDVLDCFISYKRFSAGNYAVLYNALSNYDWSSLYKEISVDAAVD